MAEVVMRDGAGMHVAVSGPANAPTLVLGTTLGTSLEIWDQFMAHLPRNLRVLRYDMRGHGLSDVTEGPYSMGQLVRDAEMICDAYEVRDAVFLGPSVGGLIALGLAIKRPDILRGLILAGAAAKVDHPQAWEARAVTAETKGMSAIVDNAMSRLFAPEFYGTKAMAIWLNMMMTTEAQGFAAVCRAIGGTDMMSPTSGLRIPTLGVAGTEDKTIPPDLVRETIDLIPGAQVVLMRGVGHIPAIEAPAAFAEIVVNFLADIGHLGGPMVDPPD